MSRSRVEVRRPPRPGWVYGKLDVAQQSVDGIRRGKRKAIGWSKDSFFIWECPVSTDLGRIIVTFITHRQSGQCISAVSGSVHAAELAEIIERLADWRELPSLSPESKTRIATAVEAAGFRNSGLLAFGAPVFAKSLSADDPDPNKRALGNYIFMHMPDDKSPSAPVTHPRPGRR